MIDVIAILIFILFLFIIASVEGFNGAHLGTLMQLSAKDPQDLYLTPGVAKYFHPWYDYDAWNGPYPYPYWYYAPYPFYDLYATN